MSDTVLPSIDPAVVAKRRHDAMISVFGEKYVETFQSPVAFVNNVVIGSPAALRFFKKDFGFLSKGLYLEYQYRSWVGYNPEVLERFTTVTTRKLENVRTLLTNNITRLERLLDQNNVKHEEGYFPNAVTVDVPIIAAQSRAYFDLLQMLDRLTVLAGDANLWGVIDSFQRSAAETLCRKAIRAFRSVLQGECIKLFAEAGRVIRAQKAAGKESAEMSAVADQQGQDIKEFEESTARDGDGDRSMDLNGMDPHQLIDDAAAASTALNEKKVKKPKAETASPQSELIAS